MSGNPVRCDYCGQFIALKDFEEGRAKMNAGHEGWNPGCVGSPQEMGNWWHVKCAKSLTPKPQEAKDG